MKLHTTFGRDALATEKNKLGSNSFLRFAKDIACSHQEKWDGSGDPEGLAGEEAPVSARLMAVLATVMLTFFLAACSESRQYNSVPAATVVLAFGDSVTHGTGAGPGEDYPNRMAAATGWQMVNAGIPGDLARDAKNRLGSALARHNPGLVIIWLGGNDFLRKRSERMVKEDLRTMIREVRSSGAEAILVSVPRLSLFRASVGALEDSAVFAELAEEESVFLIESVFSNVLSDASLRADQVHPNAEGYRVLTQGFLAQLRGAGFTP